MTAYTMVKLTCDKIIAKRRCSRSTVVEEADSRSIARLAAARKGWKTVMVKGKLIDFCPDHDPIKEGIADEAQTIRTNARLKSWLEMNQLRRSKTTKTTPQPRKIA